jgi:hypothetical protein
VRFALVFLAACASPAVTATPAPPAAPVAAVDAAAAPPADAAAAAAPAAAAPLTITVTELPATDGWSVVWTLATPAPSIIFDRRIPSNRHETWVLGDGLVWDRDPSGDFEIIRAADRSPVSTFTATFPSDLRNVGRAPSLNVRFTDGSRLLFTAQVGAYAFRCAPACARRDQRASRRWIFRTTPARTVRVIDRAAAAELAWDEPAGDVRGTYLYTGTIAATEHPRVTLVTDPGLPAWLAADTAKLLPQLFAFHGRATGVELDLVPLVLASQTDPGVRGDALRGKTLPRLIHLEAVGKDWATPSPARRGRWFEVLAHEAFHLWNAQLARRSGEKRDEWLSEGSAVFVAGRALVGAGLLSPRMYEERILTAANDCIATLRGPLYAEAADASYYACGELVHFLVDRALEKQGGALAVWAALIAHAREHGMYTTADFLAAIDARADAASTIGADVRAILDVGLGTEPAARVAHLLERARLPTKRARGGRMLVRRR